MPTTNQIATNSTASGTSLNVVFSNPVTNGNGIVVLFGLSSNNLSSIADDKSNSYTLVRTTNFFGASTSGIYYIASVSNGPQTITITTSGTDQIVGAIYEVWGTLSLDTGSSNFANASTQTTGSFTTAAQATMAFGADRSSSQPADADAWTEDIATQQVSLKHKALTPSQTINPSWTVGLSSPYAAVGESFKSTSEGPPDYLPHLRLNASLPQDILPFPDQYRQPYPVALWTGAPATVSPWFPVRKVVAADVRPDEGKVVRVQPVALWTGGAPEPLVWTPPRVVRQPVPETVEAKFTRLPYPFDVRARPPFGPGLGRKRELLQKVPNQSDPDVMNRVIIHAQQVANRLNSLVNRGRLFASGPANSLWEIRAAAHPDTRDPGALDDEIAGFGTGDAWLNVSTRKVWYCYDNTPNAAKWLGPIG